MTIVAGPDKRNSQWATDKSAFGQRMLMKMGWNEGKGLGKNQQGTNTNLRAIRREEGLGIGAKTDTFGDDGFSKTSKNFHGLLANLQAEHGTGADHGEDVNGNGKKSKKKSKKKDKNSKKMKSGEGSDAASSSLTLSRNKVTAGHARKMRESKDLTKKSTEDMAAIFGVKVDEYQANSIWGRLSSLSTNSGSRSSDEEKKNDESNDSDNKPDWSSTDDVDINEKKRRRKEKKEKKKRKREKEDAENNNINTTCMEPANEAKKRKKGKEKE